MISNKDTSLRLQQLRKLMADRRLDAYYVPSEDAHQNEYIANWDGRRAFISNFTGSAGFAIITQDKAALWTDGRYFLQAEKQLDSNWTLMRAGLKETPSKEEWLHKTLPSDGKIGADSRLLSIDGLNKFTDGLRKQQSNLELVLSSENLVDLIWACRPPIEYQPIKALSPNYSGREATDKLTKIQSFIKENNYRGFVVTALDEIAWLFNLRGSDISYNPVFFAYAWITVDSATLYCHQDKLAHDSKSTLESINVKPYDAIVSDLKAVREKLEKNSKVLVSTGCNCMLTNVLGKENLIMQQSPIETEKAIKNEVEIEGFRQSHIRDGAAVSRYFAWLEDQLAKGSIIDEVDGSDKLEEFRRLQKDCVGPSFDTISGVGPNAAIIHYKPEKGTAARITLDQIYLCDSGGQYKDGSTDITRTVHFGTPTEEEKEAFTRVLKGNIALNRAVFPNGITGLMLDCLARIPLWNAGLDYRHGTGHGVGHFLNIHEGPHSISFNTRSNDHCLKAGMTVTDEPGYYADGKFGIRIENVLVIQNAKTPNNFGNVGYLCFENVTMAPIQTKLIQTNLMTQEEIAWLNSYHEEVWNKVSPLLESTDQLAYNWLRKETMSIKKSN